MEKTVTKEIRNSNHELLRILAMYMIVLIHANMYLGYFCTGHVFTFFNGLVNGICNTGVSCFILISGYYGVKCDIRKLVKMECMMITYSLVETMLLYLAMPEQMQGAALFEQIVKSFLPFITRKYWFYSCYVCLMLLSGYLKKLTDHLDKAAYQGLLCLLFTLFSVLPTFCYFELVPDNGKGLVQMIMVYLAGRYIRLYHDVKLPKRAGIVFFLLWAVNGISHEFPIQTGGIYHHLCKDNSITNLVMALILFSFFKDLKFKSAAVNKMAGNVFAVFALNNSLVLIVMEALKQRGFPVTGGIGGFVMLAVFSFLMLSVCLIFGALRETLLGKTDRRFGVWAEREAAVLKEKIGSFGGRFFC